jgi:hypothetical protein
MCLFFGERIIHGLSQLPVECLGCTETSQTFLNTSELLYKQVVQGLQIIISDLM